MGEGAREGAEMSDKTLGAGRPCRRSPVDLEVEADWDWGVGEGTHSVDYGGCFGQIGHDFESKVLDPALNFAWASTRQPGSRGSRGSRRPRPHLLGFCRWNTLELELEPALATTLT